MYLSAFKGTSVCITYVWTMLLGLHKSFPAFACTHEPIAIHSWAERSLKYLEEQQNYAIIQAFNITCSFCLKFTSCLSRVERVFAFLKPTWKPDSQLNSLQHSVSTKSTYSVTQLHIKTSISPVKVFKHYSKGNSYPNVHNKELLITAVNRELSAFFKWASVAVGDPHLSVYHYCQTGYLMRLVTNMTCVHLGVTCASH